MTSLYELTAEWRDILDDIDLADGEITDDIEERLDELRGPLNEKAERYCQVMREWELRADMFRQEEQRLARKRKTLENNRERLRRRLLESLTAIGLPNIEAGSFSVRVNEPKQRVVVPDVDILDEHYVRRVATADKAGLAMVLKRGEFVQGAHLEDGERSLTIR